MRKQKSHARLAAAFALPLILLASWFALPARYRRALEPTAYAAATTFTVNVTGDGQDANPGDGICATAAGNCSLRAAIQESNANSGKDTINFDIPGSGVKTISPASALPEMTGAVTIDGYSQPGASPNTRVNGDNAVLLIELNGTNAGPDASGLEPDSNSTIQGLVINRFDTGIFLSHAGNVIVQGNFIGTDPTGTTPLGNTNSGINLLLSGANQIGGTSPASRNVISGNGGTESGSAGIFLNASGNNQIQGNFIGTAANGTSALGNDGYGVHFFNGALGPSNNNTIGGTAAGARNVISGNSRDGIFIPASSNNKVQGNFIGTDAKGTAALGNQSAGVFLGDSGGSALNTLIGGPTAAASNVISGNGGDGIFIKGCAGNQVQGNFIGTGASGAGALGNTQSGVLIDHGASNNTIGALIGPESGNTIAFNGNHGVFIFDDASNGNSIGSNSIFANDGVGIELGSDGVTPNDGGDADTGPNNLQNFPVITSATTDGPNTTISGMLDSKPNATFIIHFFANPTCDPSGNGEGKVFLDATSRTTGADGQLMFSSTMPIASTVGHFVTAIATDPGNNTSEFSQCVEITGATPTPTPTPTPNTFQFGQSTYSIFEDCAAITITVSRLGDSSTSASVDYVTQSGTASERTDYTTALGTLQFASGETAKSFDVLISEDSFTEGTEIASLVLSNPTGATLGSPATATLEILDDPPEPAVNTTDIAEGFVCQHYHDFLNREDDSSGLAFWTSNITSCGSDAACIQRKRTDTSAAFFLSFEFQETGGFVLRVQRVAFGKKSEEAATRISYNQFIRDARQVGEGVVVGQPGFDIRIAANEQTYATQVVTSAAFINRYPIAQPGDQYVDALFASAGVTPTTAERQAAINAFGGGGTAGRTAALRSVSDSDSVGVAEFSPTFVLMQYFGYLRRNPTDAPDNNDSGYQFWLTKLNNFGGDFRRADMVKAFITSTEYRSRFGQP